MIEFITSIDFNILDAIQNITCDFLNYVLSVFTYAGNHGILWIALGLVLLFFRKTRYAGIVVLAALTIGYLTGDIIIKNLVQRVRPFYINTDVTLFIKAPSGFSFPSGHSTAAMGTVTVLLAKQRRIGLIALPVALIIMFSRLYFYVHYPSDVLCGALLGFLAGLLALFIFSKTPLERKLSGNS